ncbi:L,D-transpeptidase [uncultured Cohaesibacter sp.]|uniref:L,D-transpeptidase n=1 Tax=uncultured Cohaesibacter sp. TaxID=1002546 RepID=UPI0029C8222F|nr:L,D-transpeptidase [uncultured Cohaesibacter sp.]
MTRRTLVRGAMLSGLGLLAACGTRPKPSIEDTETYGSFEAMYGPLPNERFPLPAVDLRKIDRRFLRQEVRYPTSEKVGTLVVDTSNYYLYLIQENGRAIRYGVGLGRAGFEWSGRAIVARKAIWPTWTPPTEMIERQPELEKWSWQNGGMPPGPSNPLGARALYIYQDGRDTLYRLHGTAEVWSIGKAVSSGCVRLLNQDIIDLHRRVPNQTPIVVI